MSCLVYTEMLGLREVDHVDPFSLPAGTIIRARLGAHVPEDWYQHVHSFKRGLRNGLEWKQIRVENLPKRLKTEALLMDIRL